MLDVRQAGARDVRRADCKPLEVLQLAQVAQPGIGEARARKVEVFQLAQSGDMPKIIVV